MIRHRGIEHNIFSDAPFVAARICAIQCTHDCPGCFHKHLQADDDDIIHQEAVDIIREVINNPFNEGIVLGGLEWTEQADEMFELISAAQAAGLEVMLYTHMSVRDYAARFGRCSGIYIKHGEYVSGDQPHEEFGIRLAGDGQHIIYYI